MSTPSGDVRAAFAILLDEIAAAVEAVNAENVQALAAHNFDRVIQLAERARSIEQFRERVNVLQRDWQSLIQGVTHPGGARPAPQPVRRRVRRKPGAVDSESETRSRGAHLAKGLRTPENAFRLPILRALIQLGGSGRMRAVLDLVHEEMAQQLNHHDYEAIPSNPNLPRWQNSAQWCRAKLIEEGAMRSDSAHGYWEISDEGRAWLTAHNAPSPAPPPVVRSVPPARPAQPKDDAADDLFDAEESDGSQVPIADADWAIIEQGLQPLPQLLENVVMVFRTMHRRGLTYTSAARAVAERRGLSTVNTIYDACTRRLALTAAQFRELAASPTRLHEHLARYYPAFDALLYELLIDAF